MLDYKVEEMERLENKLKRYFEYLDQEDDDICKIDLFKTIVNIYAERERLVVEAINNMSKNHQNTLEKWEKTHERYSILEDKFKQEREETEQTLMGLPLLFIEDPVSTMQMLFKNVDRSMKINDQSGGGWKWELYFGWKTRLKMAWRLIFHGSDVA